MCKNHSSFIKVLEGTVVNVVQWKYQKQTNKTSMTVSCDVKKRPRRDGRFTSYGQTKILKYNN